MWDQIASLTEGLPVLQIASGDTAAQLGMAQAPLPVLPLPPKVRWWQLPASTAVRSGAGLCARQWTRCGRKNEQQKKNKNRKRNPEKYEQKKHTQQTQQKQQKNEVRKTCERHVHGATNG